MANIGEENKVNGVFGGVEIHDLNRNNQFEQAQMQGQEQVSNNKMVKAGFWSKFKAFWLQEIDWNKEIKVELTPYQQKVEDEINEFLHQEITWEKVHDFLFQDITFGKKKTEV